MVDIPQILQFKYPSAKPLADYALQDKGDGVVFIATWNDALGKQPTPDELAVIEASQEYADWLAAAQTKADGVRTKADAIKAAVTAMESGTGTTAQRLTRLETAIAFLLKNKIRDL
ncbi:hypothetical protein BH10ACI2_BH10ACI2_21040 [soil metagenome]